MIAVRTRSLPVRGKGFSSWQDELLIAWTSSRLACGRRVKEGPCPVLVLSFPTDRISSFTRSRPKPARRPASSPVTPPRCSRSWTGRGAVVKLVLERGVDLAYRNEYGGDALGATLHGSVNGQDPNGGPGSKLSEEAHPGDYPEIVEMLLAAGIAVPARVDSGSAAVRDVLRRHGAVDPE